MLKKNSIFFKFAIIYTDQTA